MSIWFMFDCHAFHRLDGKPIDETMDEVEQCVDHDKGYGFIAGKGEHKDFETIHICPGDQWRGKVREALLEAQKPRWKLT